MLMCDTFLLVKLVLYKKIIIKNYDYFCYYKAKIYTKFQMYWPNYHNVNKGRNVYFKLN